MMKEDTMIVYLGCFREVTKWIEGSFFYTSIGEKEIMDSIKIILKKNVMKNCFKQLPMIFLFSFFLMSCGETIDGSTSDQDYFGSNERRGEEFVFEYKGLPFTGKVKNIKGENRYVAPFLHDLYYAIPESYSMGDSYYTFKITPEILSFNDGKLEGEYSLLNFKDEEVYV